MFIELFTGFIPSFPVENFFSSIFCR